MAGIGGLFGEGSAASQFLLYGVGFAIGQALLGPVLEEVRTKTNADSPVIPLTPDQLADMVLRQYLTVGEGEAEAKLSGIDSRRFGLMVDDAGEPPGPVDLATLLARGQIPESGTGAASISFEQGIAESRLKNKWTGSAKLLAQEWPTPADVINAYIRSQIDEGGARELYAKARGNPDYFDLLFNTRGNPPAPGELITLVRRRVIPSKGTGPSVLSMQQGIAEGDTKNKWFPAFEALLEEIPPARVVATLLRTGAITTERAQELWQENGLSAADAAAYAKSVSGEKLAGTRQLAEGAILTLYDSRAITAEAATTHLEALGYGAPEAALVLELTDLQREVRFVTSAITRIGTLYVGHKITRDTVVRSLTALEVPQAMAAHYLATWDLERAANVRQLTPAQIVKAWEVGALDEGEAMGELEAIGYTPFDSWVLLSNAAKQPQAGKPPKGPAGPGVIP